jgi:Putative adhesin
MTQLSTTGPVTSPGRLRMTPGRRVALVIGVPLVLSLIGGAGFSVVELVGQASFPVSYAVPVHDGQVNVGLNGGNLTVLQGQGGTARLTGTVQYTFVRPGVRETTTAGNTQIALDCHLSLGNCGMNATLDVPARTALTASTDGGDASVSGFDAPITLNLDGGNLTASDLRGNLQVNTGGGDLSGSELAGDFVLSTQGGNITANNFQGDLQADTGGGDLSGSGMAGQVTVSSEGGNINENAVTAPTVTAQSGGGDVTLTFTQPPTNVQITAEGGNVTVVLPAGATKYDIATPGTDGGNVSYPGSLFSSSSHDMITINGGGGNITITQG